MKISNDRATYLILKMVLMDLTIRERCMSLFPISVLILMKVSTVLGSLERRTFPLPVLPEITYDLNDVIMKPTKSTILLLNATFIDPETKTTHCDLSTSKEKDFRFPPSSEICNITGLSLITSSEATISINISGNELRLLPIYYMGEKYIIPEELDRHRTDHINSLLIYLSAKNTTVSVCFDQKLGGHLSEQFSDQLFKWIDGELQCYRKTLGRNEIWMINNASVHRGIEIIANNPIGVLECHFTNSSFGLQNERFIDGPWDEGMDIVWEGYPPFKFWGKQFVLFPDMMNGSQYIYLTAEKDTVVSLNSSSEQRTISLPGRSKVYIALKHTQWVTLNGSSEMIVYSHVCDRSGSNVYYTSYRTSIDSYPRHEHISKSENAKFILVCTSLLDALLEGEIGINLTGKGNLYLGNQRIYFGLLRDGEYFSLHFKNFSDNDCFLTRTIDSRSCFLGINSSYGNEAGRNSTISVPINDSHLTNDSRADLIDSSSRVVIEVHKNDNVNKSRNGNFSDMGLKGTKTKFIRNRSDKQIASNRTRYSPSETMKTSRPSTITMAPFHISSKGQIDMMSFSSDIRDNRSENSSTTGVPFVTNERGNTNYQLNELTTNKLRADNTDSFTQIDMNTTDLTVPKINQETTTNAIFSQKTSNKDSTMSTFPDKHHSQNSISNDTNRMISQIKKILNSSEIKEGSQDSHAITPSHSAGNEKETSLNDSVIPLRKGFENISRIFLSNQTSNSKSKSSHQDLDQNSTEVIDQISDNINSKKTDKLSNDRFKVVVDIISSGKKDININPRVRYESKNPTYVHLDDDRGKLEQVGDGKSLVAVIVSLSSAVFAVIAIILVFFFIEYFSRRKQLRKTRIRPFLSDY